MTIKPKRLKGKLTKEPVRADADGVHEIHKLKIMAQGPRKRRAHPIRISAKVLFKAAFQARAVKCKFCGSAFVPAQGRDADYCTERCSDLVGEGYGFQATKCLFCDAPLSKAQIKHGVEICPRCQSGASMSSCALSWPLVSILV